MPRGRKREFDRSDVLLLAMNHFWENGYDGTGLTDLLDAVGIARQSLYSTFGSKHELFLESLEVYFETVLRPMVDKLKGDEAGFDAIESLFWNLSKKGTGKLKFGCLLANTIAELASQDPSVSKIAKSQVDHIEKAFSTSVSAGQKKGKIRKDVKPLAMARQLVASMQGLLVAAKLPGSKPRLRDSVEVLVKSIKK